MLTHAKRIYIERGRGDGGVARRAVASSPGAEVEEFGSLAQLLRRIERLPAQEAKRMLVVAERAGGFVKPFPTRPPTAERAWKYFIPAIGCPADCGYCFLQVYHPANVPVVFSNQCDLLAEVAETLEKDSRAYLYGGELCDNLLLEDVADIVPEMMSLLSRHPDAALELRTKGTAIDPLLAAGAVGNVIVSWTFSPEEIVREFEAGTASAIARVEAAARLQQAGFSIGVRLDPIILGEDWGGAYGGLISLLSEKLDPSGVDSVHLGGLRFTPPLKQAVFARHRSSAPFDGEFLMCRDGKMRYPRPLRAAAYAAIAGMFSDCGWRVPMSLFMETRSVRREVRL